MNYSTENYDDELRCIDQYRTHEHFLPFIGKDFDKSGILLVGESNYIAETDSIEDFEKWWTDEWELFSNIRERGYIDIRGILERNIKDGRDLKHRRIYYNPLELYCEECLNLKIDRTKEEDRAYFSHFAFMNFFQFPAKEQQKSIWRSIRSYAKNRLDKRMYWEKTLNISIKTFESLVEVLLKHGLKHILFVSKNAYDNYMASSKRNRKYESLIDWTKHPNVWNKEIAGGIFLKYKKDRQ